jgi:hypothetical protein
VSKTTKIVQPASVRQPTARGHAGVTEPRPMPLPRLQFAPEASGHRRDRSACLLAL